MAGFGTTEAQLAVQRLSESSPPPAKTMFYAGVQ